MYPVFSVTSLYKTKRIANSVTIAFRAMLIASQLVKEFPALYEPRRFIACRKTKTAVSLHPEPDKSNSPTTLGPIYSRSVLVLSLDVPVGFPSTLFSSGFSCLTPVRFYRLSSVQHTPPIVK